MELDIESFNNPINQDVVKTIWYSIRNAGDGSAYLRWFLTREKAQLDQNNQSESWGETCLGSITTVLFSKEHREAIENDSMTEKEMK